VEELRAQLATVTAAKDKSDAKAKLAIDKIKVRSERCVRFALTPVRQAVSSLPSLAPLKVNLVTGRA